MTVKEMRVLAPDGLNKKGIQAFEKAGILVDIPKNREPKFLMEILPSFHGMVVRSATKVTSDIIEAGAGGAKGEGKLQIIGRAGVGYDNIDLNAATSKGIVVKNAPSGNTVSTAELTMALIGTLARNIAIANISLKHGGVLDIVSKLRTGELKVENVAELMEMIEKAAGIWNKKQCQGQELANKTLGIIGCGRIGGAVAKRASAFDMRVLAFDPYNQSNPLVSYVSKEQLLRESDFVTLHPFGKTQEIGAAELSIMKETAYLINAARGTNVDPAALYEALRNGKLAGAALDVHVGEPKVEGARFESALRELPNVLMSPHLGASTKEAQEMTAIEMAAVMIGFMNHGDMRNALNFVLEEEATKITYPLKVFHADRTGMFAIVGGILAEYGINILQIVSKPAKPIQGRESEERKAISTFLTYKPASEEAISKIRLAEGVERVMAETPQTPNEEHE